MYTIGIDVGGMSLKFGLVDDNGNIISTTRVKTAMTPDQVIDDIVDRINFLLNEQKITLSQIKGIGIGVPGAVDSATGVVVHLPNIPGWTIFRLLKGLKKLLILKLEYLTMQTLLHLAK